MELNDPNATCPICKTREPEDSNGQFPFEHKCKKRKVDIDEWIKRTEEKE